jgi:Tol biopolymer transport system component
MRKIYHFYRVLMFALLVCSCSIEINQTSGPPTQSNTPAIATTSIVAGTRVPVTWAHLELTGKLIYLSSTMEGDSLTSDIQMLDLVTGSISTILSIPSAWVYYATVSPDAKMLVMSYAPPSQPNSPSSRSLYIIPLDAFAEPQPLFTPPTLTDRYTQAEWSPDGKSVYYVHYNQEDREGQFFEDYDISKITYPEGKQEKILEHAFWPRVSPDSSKLVYVYVDPASGRNELFLANADGSNPQPVALTGLQPQEIIDAPIFSPDGQSILFSVPSAGQAYQPNWFERLMGIQVAKAHNVPSDWWSVPVNGGTPTQLTNIQSINLFGSISPDKRYVASLSGEGIFVMNLDGSNPTMLVSDPDVHGTLNWIP